jgi:hypothetical protein
MSIQNSMIYAATDQGVYELDKNGNVLQSYTTENGLGDNYVRGIYADQNSIYAATWGGGLSMKKLDMNDQ